MRVQSNQAPVAKTPAKKAPQAAPAPKRDEFSMDFDRLSFGKPAPTAAQIAEAKKAIDALAAAPSIPLSNKAKTAWLTEAKKQQAAAKAALDVLSDAEWEKKIPAAEVDKARDAVYAHADKIERCEERAGLKPLPKPLNPFRPLFEYTSGIGNGLPNNAFGGIIAAFGIMIAIPLDIADMVTRPIQVVMWPVAQVWRGVQKAGHMVGIG